MASVPREMFRAGEHASRAQSVIESNAHFCDEARIRAEAAVFCNRAFGIHVEIQHRSEIEIASGDAKFDRHRSRHLLGQSDIMRAAKLRSGRPRRKRLR